MNAKYEFIDAEKDNFPISKMCAWAGVSRSGYYDWVDRPASAAAQRRERLAAVIEAAFDDSDATYGYRRIHAALVPMDVDEDASPELVRALMRELGLVPCQPRPFRPTTTIAGDAAAVADLLGRDFTAQAPGTQAAPTSPTSAQTGLAVPGHGDRLRDQGMHRLCHGRAHAHGLGGRGGGYGRP